MTWSGRNRCPNSPKNSASPTSRSPSAAARSISHCPPGATGPAWPPARNHDARHCHRSAPSARAATPTPLPNPSAAGPAPRELLPAQQRPPLLCPPTSPPATPTATAHRNRPSPSTPTVPDGPPAIDEADLPAVGISATTNLADACDLVKRTARHYKHPRRGELKFTRGRGNSGTESNVPFVQQRQSASNAQKARLTGPILQLAVSPDTLDRALLFADTFLKAAAELRWSPIPPPEPEPPDPRHYYGRPPEPKPNPGPRYVDLEVDGHRIEFSIEERFTLNELPPTQTELNKQKRNSWYRPERRTETIWSGRLRLKRPSHRYPYGIDGKSWFETAHRRIDSLIPKMLADFRAVAARMQEVDEKDERDRIEHERQQKLREELAERRAANQTLIHELERQAGAWSRAQLLRRYLRAARRATAPDGFFVESANGPLDFLSWAEHYVNQLDPLHPEPHDPDLKYDRTAYSYGEDEKRPMQELRRLMGHSWESATKLLAATTDVDEDSDDDDD